MIPDCLHDLLVEIPRFLDAQTCRRTIELAQRHGFHEATVTKDGEATLRPEVRNNERVIFDDADLAAEFWAKVEPHSRQMRFGSRAIGLNERFRIYRYRPGHFFDWHQDGVFSRENGESSMFTLLISLNDAFEGGATSFSSARTPYLYDDFAISAEAGKALLFFHPISHRGDIVLTGEKFMLRTDVMYAPKR